MRRFTVYSEACLAEWKAIWEEAGFVFLDAAPAVDEQPPDLLLHLSPVANPHLFWQQARSMRPKLILIADNAWYEIPDDAKDMFDRQEISGEAVCFTVASRLEGLISVPVWEMYRQDGFLSQPAQMSALAGAVYRFLLTDVMRETFEWCGHTFSVLGPA
jgi:hypothetical protein